MLLQAGVRAAGTADARAANGAADVSIAALTADSRRVTPGTLFAALPGIRTDGRAYIADAVARGADGTP